VEFEGFGTKGVHGAIPIEEDNEVADEAHGCVGGIPTRKVEDEDLEMEER